MHSAFGDIILVLIVFNLPLITMTIRWVIIGMILIIPLMRRLLPLLLLHRRSPGRIQEILAEAITGERKSTSPERRFAVKCGLPHEMDNISKNENYRKHHPLCIASLFSSQIPIPNSLNLGELKQRLASVQKISPRPKINKIIENRIAMTIGANKMVVSKSTEKYAPLHMGTLETSNHTLKKTGDSTIGAKGNSQNMSTQLRLVERGKDTTTWQLEKAVEPNSRDRSTQVELHEVGKATPLSSKATCQQASESNLVSANQRTSQISSVLFDDLWQQLGKRAVVNRGLYEQEDVNYSIFMETHL
ncbi:unnamed protein product [Rodentolepis nana]|uniref:Ion_trans_2 domain-containing protein n=1 Tax=Rodentolepis nana TaxID=102285 RepID=A0A0R3SZV2_RODNA|nr:unnamed protein product [Rodentolepis nana]